MNYFEWLCSLVYPNSIDKGLLLMLDNYDYNWHLLLDQNRAKAGEALRRRYASEAGIFVSDVRQCNCSVLEMLIALSEQMSNQTDGLEPYECFWIMIDNMHLRDIPEREANNVIINFINNNYVNCDGGPFPLYNYHGDIRGLDLYSQMNAWLEENFPHQNIF